MLLKDFAKHPEMGKSGNPTLFPALIIMPCIVPTSGTFKFKSIMDCTMPLIVKYGASMNAADILIEALLGQGPTEGNLAEGSFTPEKAGTVIPNPGKGKDGIEGSPGAAKKALINISG